MDLNNAISKSSMTSVNRLKSERLIVEDGEVEETRAELGVADRQRLSAYDRFYIRDLMGHLLQI
jgi:hypothetical protein